MTYPLSSNTHGDDSLLSLLSTNTRNNGCLDRKGRLPLLQQSFMEAGRQFKAIDAPTKAVIVPYGQGQDLITELCAVAKEFDAHRFYELLKQAQQYSVSVFPNIWRQLVEAGAIEETQPGDGIYFLREEFYSEEFGLSTERVGKQSFFGV